jgi:hypothetical protein
MGFVEKDGGRRMNKQERLASEMLQQVLGIGAVDADSAVAFAIARRDRSNSEIQEGHISRWGSDIEWRKMPPVPLFHIRTRYKLER